MYLNFDGFGFGGFSSIYSFGSHSRDRSFRLLLILRSFLVAQTHASQTCVNMFFFSVLWRHISDMVFAMMWPVVGVKSHSLSLSLTLNLFPHIYIFWCVYYLVLLFYFVSFYLAIVCGLPRVCVSCKTTGRWFRFALCACDGCVCCFNIFFK